MIAHLSLKMKIYYDLTMKRTVDAKFIIQFSDAIRMKAG